MDWISKLLEIKKIPTKFIFIIFISSLLVLFLSQGILKTMKLNELINQYKPYISIVTIVSGVILIIEFFSILWTWYNKKSNKNKQKKIINNRLSQLDNSEKAILREFFIQNKHTIQLPVDNPTVEGLIHSKILKYVSRRGQITMSGNMFSMKISEDVLNILEASDIDIPTGEN